MLDHKIETFLTLCETMNYRLAAERLHITQPAVTQQIHALEEYYQCPLFVYEARQLTKTEQARQLERVSRSMAYQEKQLAQTLLLSESRHIRIGVTKTIGEVVIAEHLARFLAEPGYRLSVFVDNTEQLLEQLNHAQLDFALVEGHFNQRDYGSRRYSTECFSGLCGVNHPFAGKTVSLRAAFGERLLLREAGSGTRNIFEGLLYEQNAALEDFSTVTCVNNYGLLKNLLALDCGISFGYEVIARKNADIAAFYLEDIQIFHDFSYVYLKNGGAEQFIALFDRYAQ